MKNKIKKVAHRTGKFMISKGKSVMMLVGLFILYLLIRKVGLDKLWSIMKGMNPLFLILAIIPWVLTLIAGTYRLKKIVGHDIGFFEMFKIYTYGYLLNYASPIQGFGAASKIAMLKMKKVKISKSSASVGSEIVYDILFTSVIVVIFFLYHFDFIVTQLQKVMNPELFLLGGVIVLIVAIVAWFLRKNEFVREFFKHLFGSLSIKNVLHLMPVTFLLWIFPVLTIWLMFLAVGRPISLWIAFGSACIGFIFGLATFIPGGLGVRDAITAYIYSLSGLPIDVTISVAIFNRFFTLGVTMLIVAGIVGWEKVKKGV